MILEYMYVLTDWLMKAHIDAKVPLENFEPAYEGFLESETRIELDLERVLITVFLGSVEREYRKGVMSCTKQVYLRQAVSIINLIMSSAHLVVFSGWDDTEIGSELQDLLNVMHQG